MVTPTDGRSTIELLLGRGRLIRQGLRAIGGDGSHRTVEDSNSTQYAEQAPGFAALTFERLRRTRLSAQNCNPSCAEIGIEVSVWALSTVRTVVAAVEEPLGADPPDLFEWS